MLGVGLCEYEIRLREGRALLEAKQHEGDRASHTAGPSLSRQVGPHGREWMEGLWLERVPSQACLPWLHMLCLGNISVTSSVTELPWPHLGGHCPQAASPHPQLTSKRCELTFLPFLFQVTRGLGSPVA